MISYEMRTTTDKLKRDIESVPNDVLPIMEIFTTYEGEGLHIGTPRTFIRVGGCRVGCLGCDSTHTWGLARSNLMTIEDIVARVAKLGVFQVTLTGGEPMHYPEQIVRLAQQLRLVHCRISLETSGQILDDQVFKWFDRLSLDLKTPSSGITLTHAQLVAISGTRDIFSVRDHLPTDIAAFTVQIKAVITSQVDLDFLTSHCWGLLTNPNHPLVLTPAAGKDHSIERMQSILLMIASWNSRNNYNIRVIPQAHVLLGFR